MKLRISIFEASFFALALSFAACSGRGPDSSEASKSALNTNPQTTHFAVYAQNSATLRDRVGVTGGDVGVRLAGTGPFVGGAYELVLTADSRVDTARNAIANRVQLVDRARVGDVQVQQLINQNGFFAHQYPFVATMPALPPLAPVTTGTAVLTVNTGTTLLANPGNYGAVSVGDRGILRLKGGVYHMASLSLRNDARIESLAPVQVRVAGRLSTLDRAFVGTATGVALTAGDLRIEISGKNGNSGLVTDSPKAAMFGNDAKVSAVMLVPNGTLQTGQRNIMVGAYVGRDVYVDMNSTITYQSGIGPSGCLESCDDNNACTIDTCSVGTCVHAPSPAGTSCGDNDACNGAEKCDGAGRCQAGTPVVCTALDPCHVAGNCDTATGACSNPAKSDGTTCDDGNACTKSDTCTTGVCGGLAYACSDGLDCTTDSCNGDGTCTFAVTAGNCLVNGTCYAGATSNPANPCEECAPAVGQNGWSPKPMGTVCDDGNACTKADVCDGASVCGGTAYLCSDGLACTADVCNGDGTCSFPILAGNCVIGGGCYGVEATNPGNACQTCAPGILVTGWTNKPTGTTCDDSNACTQSDTCQAGACVGASPVACGALDQCHVAGTCDPATGACSNPAMMDGEACNDGDACTRVDACQTGACVGGSAVVCVAADQCHAAGTCDSTTGACSNPAKTDGAACEDGNACTAADTCQAGACLAGGPTSVDDGNPCTADACDPVAGVTHVPVAGASCSATLDRIPVNQFKGLNWGYNRTQPDLGNYSRGFLRLPYLDVSDSPATLVKKTNVVMDNFADVGANTIRIPVNIETTLNGWSNYYRYVVGTALERGFKVILCYWLPSTNKLTDMDNVKAMWHALAAEYFRDNTTGLYPLVFYELANEPAGYATDGAEYLTDIKNITSYLDQDFPGIKKRIIVGGTDYSAYPGPVAVDPDLQDTYLAVHFYETWAHDYSTSLKGLKYYPKYFDDAIVYQISWRLGVRDPSASGWFNRIIMTEFGQWTDRQYRYTAQTTQRDEVSITPNTFYSNDVEGYRIAYVWGLVNVVNRLQLGSVLWGGLIEDGYSLFKITSQPTGLARNDFSTRTHLVELDAPYRAGLWGPLSTSGSYVMPVASPVASPDAAEYDTPLSVTLATTTTDATIYYTTDGSMPTTASPVYAAPIPVASTTTVKAIATKSGMQTSTTGSTTYAMVPVITPTASLAAGTYNDVQDVTLASRTAGASLYYTLDGSTPTTSSTLYAGPIHISGTSTLKAIATNSAGDASGVMSVTYTLVASTPTASLAAGTYSTTQIVNLASATPGASIYYTTDGSTPTTSSTLYTGTITIAATTTLKAISAKEAMTASPVLTVAYAISALPPTVSPASGTYAAAQTVTLTPATTDASIHYTLDGSTPTAGSALYTGPITLNSSTILKAISTKAGLSDSSALLATYFIGVNTRRVCTAPASGLVSWWQGEGNYVDVFGLNPGQNGGTVGFAPAGAVGQGFSLTGADASYVNVANAASLNLTAAMTLEAWINPATLGGSLMDKSTAGGQDGYVLDISNNKLRLTIGNLSVLSDTDLPTAQWSHVVGTYDGATMMVFINGLQAGTLAAAGAIPTNALPLRLGADSTGGSLFTGVVDEAKIYGRALNAVEVNDQYQAGRAKSGVVSWWHGDSNFTDALGLNNGVNGGAAAFATGTVGRGFRLTGAASSFVAAFDSNSLDFTTAVTMDAWITATVLGGRIFDKITGGGGNGYLLDTWGSKLRVFFGNSATSTGATLSTGVATHIAATFSTTSGLVKVYINGVLAGAVARTDAIPANALVFRMGADSAGNSRFNGIIDEPRVFNRELSASEILALYREVPCL